MLIEQRETSELYDLFLDSHINDAVKTIRELSDEEFADTDTVNLACNEAMALIRSFQKKMSDLEKKLSKQTAKRKILEKIHEGDYDD
jgi:DNA-binding protein YbaB